MKPFGHPKKWLAGLAYDSASKLLTLGSDVALAIADSSSGVIRDVAFGNAELQAEIGSHWLGTSWRDTVTIESRPKLEALLKDAGAKGMPRWRQLNHPTSSGVDLPIQYCAVKLGAGGHIIALGKSMRPMVELQQQLVSAQQSMEREYMKLRQTEARHRLLFQVAAEAVLIVDAGTRKIIEANPAAARLLGEGGKRLVGRLFPEGFDEESSQVLQAMLGSVRAIGRADDVIVRAADDGREFAASAALFREDRASYFLIRLSASQANAGGVAAPRQNSKVLEIVASAPEGFVVTDLEGRILFANRAFLDLVQLATEEQARNEPIERWLGRPGVDFNLLTAQLREHGSLRLFATQLRGEYGSNTDVEICAVSVPNSADPCCGFTIRDVGQRVTFDRQASRDKPRSVAQLTELVGRVPLKDLVRESTDMIEKLCIEAALEITGDNRASAAEILGLSRQSLYAKLRRYGLGELASAADESFE